MLQSIDCNTLKRRKRKELDSERNVIKPENKQAWQNRITFERRTMPISVTVGDQYVNKFRFFTEASHLVTRQIDQLKV